MKKILPVAIISFLMLASLTQANDVTIINPGIVTHQIKEADIFSKLPIEKAKLFQAKDEELKASYKDFNIKIIAATKELNKELLNEPFNKEAYLKKAEELEKIQQDKLDIRIKAIAELASSFTAEERKVLLGAFKENTGSRYHSPVKNR